MYRTPNPIDGQQGTQYSLEELDFFINYVGLQIDMMEDDEECDLWNKDAECDMAHCFFLRKMTNGEYFYSLYEIFQELISPEVPKDLIAYKEAIFTELFNDATEHALYMMSDREPKDQEIWSTDLWRLYEFTNKHKELPMWTDESGNPTDPPALSKMTENDWRRIVSDLFDEFFWDTDYEMFRHFSDDEEQPHYPTFPEYRKALLWFKDMYETADKRSKED
jgi:hypothetical protein